MTTPHSSRPLGFWPLMIWALFLLIIVLTGQTMAFIDLGDQFIAIAATRHRPPDVHRHFGLVVDDRDAVVRAL
ncbi:MAG: hypothetical protein ACE5FM_06890, partial [Methyloligellaceae bacterium]